MFIIFGTRTAGRIYRPENTLVSTTFLHVFLVPLIPLNSIQVVQKGFFFDVGEPLPLDLKSMLAAYLRTGMFVVLCFGIALAFDGLFLNDVVEADKPKLAALGAAIFAGAGLTWLWATFVLGAKTNPARFSESAMSRFVGGAIVLAAFMSGMYLIASLQPKEVTLESLAADRTMSDEKALRAMAALQFPKDKDFEIVREGDGISLAIKSLWSSDPTMRVFQGQTGEDALRITKGAALMTLLGRSTDLIRQGSRRHLTKLTISLSSTAWDGAELKTIEVYRIAVPFEKFHPLMSADNRFSNQLSRDTLFGSGKVFEEVGVVEVDHFDHIVFSPN